MAYFASREPGEFRFTDILYQKQDWVARITINRPESFNCYTTGTLQELITAIDDASFDDRVGVI
ncbi:MAG: 1,4-dihydroxy-2-naphthoyl-CoA synthase, partial [Deltaproteobacteria bacterium]